MAQLAKDIGSLTFKPNFLLEKPELLARVGYIAAQWSEIEVLLGLLLANFLNLERKAALEMYMSFTNTYPREGLLKAAASTKLEKEIFDDFCDVYLKEIKNCAKQRNKVVHSGWATSNNYPDALIRIPLDKRVEFQEMSREIRVQSHSHSFKNFAQTLEVWTVKDFEDVSDKLEDLSCRLTATGKYHIKR